MSALRVEKAAADIRYKDDKRALPKYGLVILIGVDELAVRFHAWQLMAHSSVFRDSDVLTVLRNHLEGFYDMESDPDGFGNVLMALELCERYDMDPIGRGLLKSAIEAEALQLAIHLLDAFAWASKYDSMEIATKILVKGPEFFNKPKAHFPGTLNFDRNAAAQVPSTWVWAIKEAEAEVDMREESLSDLYVWKRFASAFVKHLL